MRVTIRPSDWSVRGGTMGPYAGRQVRRGLAGRLARGVGGLWPGGHSTCSVTPFYLP